MYWIRHGAVRQAAFTSLYSDWITTDYKAVSTAVTNEDGRTDSPILTTDDFQTGQYRLVFHAGPYLDLHFSDLPEPKFLSDIPIDFAMADAASHYHVPLLLSPFGYSTYRGS